MLCEPTVQDFHLSHLNWLYVLGGHSVLANISLEKKSLCFLQAAEG